MSVTIISPDNLTRYVPNSVTYVWNSVESGEYHWLLRGEFHAEQYCNPT